MGPWRGSSGCLFDSEEALCDLGGFSMLCCAVLTAGFIVSLGVAAQVGFVVGGLNGLPGF